MGFLLEEIRLRGERPELRDEVITLGKKFGIVTPYTSYLVVEDEPLVANRPPPPPVMRPWDGQPPPRPEPRPMMREEASRAERELRQLWSG